MNVAASERARLAVDIGGTFTDVVVERHGTRTSTKVLTTPSAPQNGAIEGIRSVLAMAGLKPADVSIFVHGTTLATNAIIERKGARTALVTTAGFRDSVEIGTEGRFDQYDLRIEKPAPLVERSLRFEVDERLDARGNILRELDVSSVDRVIEALVRHEVESVAIATLHSYVNPVHERRIRDLIGHALPDVWQSISSEVSPEIREVDRFSTTCANAYVQPVVARYLQQLRSIMTEDGFDCPTLLMTSSGGLMTIETAMRFPIRLVESGPAGGAIYSSQIAMACGLDEVVSFDMGGTTAKICLIDGGEPQKSRNFEVDRRYRFMKGSGLPVRIPVIEMVEIGSGGGSIAHLDSLDRIRIGPHSAGSAPGPVCYGLGGVQPTVTDANLVLGRVAPDSFAAGFKDLDTAGAASAIDQLIGSRLNLDAADAALGISEMVEETMANAARVHAIERGKDIRGRTMIAFGGAAPLHVARLAEKLGIDTVIVPMGAGVGSAIGFLRAPIAFEVARSRYLSFDAFDADAINAIYEEMATEAYAEVKRGAPDAELIERRYADMRYIGQGHEIQVMLPSRPVVAADRAAILRLFKDAYLKLFGRTIEDMPVEALTWNLEVSTRPPTPGDGVVEVKSFPATSQGTRRCFSASSGAYEQIAVYDRGSLDVGATFAGPAIVTERETTTLVTHAFDGSIDIQGNIRLTKKDAGSRS